MSSGVKVDESTVEMYNAIKLKKKLRYLIMHIDESDGLIKVQYAKEKDCSMSQEEEFSEFLDRLPPDSGRYCIIDLNIPQKNGATKDIMHIITWCPEKASMKSNILYTTSKKSLMDKIREGMTDIQANDLSDLVYSELLARGCK